MEFKIYVISIFLVLLNSLSKGKSSINKNLPKISVVKPIQTSTLEPCKTYSLPPSYRDNCTKDGGIFTETYSMGTCNNKECKCPYMTCISGSSKTSTKTTPKIISTRPSTLEPCKIYSLPPYYRENCTKDGGVFTETYSMGSCGNKECKCPYMTCVTGSPKTSAKTTPKMTTKALSTTSISTTLPPCMTYSLPPYFRENCTKNGGRVTQTHSKAYCDNNKPCECPYYTCVAVNGNPRTAPDTANKVEPTTLPPCMTYSLPPYFRENCTKSGGKVTQTHSMAYCRNNKVCQCPYYTCAGSNANQVTATIDDSDKETITVRETVTVTKTSEPVASSDVTGKCIKKWGKCGGVGFTGPSCCESGLTCRKINKYYSQCM
ncbi:carbohydrate-binding module family 1 protein [Piromyces sp. E2]|nr:carbohydrate-binding module family 1 protein [Piromyces sp. E2]|eukprot:OUM68786.1 carbohydrate-binding module family 1 protein [Piromyces sp. E2]